MRRSGKWMVLADDRILELLRSEGPLAPSKIAQNNHIPWGRQHIGNRCRKLESYSLVRNVGNGVYVITEEGKQYLDGELDASSLEINENGRD